MISTRHLQYSPAHAAALTFPDVEVPPGGVLLLCGRAGSGKSTWLALAAGLLVASGGTLSVAGADLAAMASSARDAWRVRAVGLLPRQPSLNPVFGVRANLALAFFAAGLREDPWAISHAMAALKIEHLASRAPDELSDAQTRQVALARALLLGPKLLLADAPTEGLDDDAAQDMLAQLQIGAALSGATLVVATRDARLVRELAHAQVLDLDGGPAEPELLAQEGVVA